MDNNQLTVKRTLNAPIEHVWDALTIPEKMRVWFAPEGLTTPEVTADLRTGGAYRITMHGGNDMPDHHKGTFIVGGTYKVIEKPTKLVFTWLWEGAPAETHTTTVSITLRKIAEKQTEFTLVHSGFADSKMQNEHDKGWQSTCNKLTHFVEVL